MKSTILRLIALILAALLLLTGCGAMDSILEKTSIIPYESSRSDTSLLQELLDAVGENIDSLLENASVIPYDQMEYSRPDMTELQEILDTACDLAAAGEDIDAVVDAIFDFYDVYDWFYTCYSLADIRYCGDLTDIYWEAEYTYCAENSVAVDAALEELCYTLARSPLREELEAEEYFGAGYFDSYDGENMWDETFTAMLEKESALQNTYYTLSTQALEYEYGTGAYYDACAEDMAQLLVDLIRLRQEIAAYWGYADYVQFANDFYYYRDFTPAQTAAYLEDIRLGLVDMYQSMSTDVWNTADKYCSEQQTFDYVRQAARNMGGTVWESFQLLESAGLYDIGYGENKYNASFEVYLTSYWEPFIFINPSMTRYDCLTFSHEFGHFCNDYASYGSYSGIDVLEVFSQGMEYLSLCYADNGTDLVEAKMADSLCVYIEQAAFACFEQKMYALTGEDLSVEGLYALYEEVATAYGFEHVGFDPREFVTIPHYYTNPMYIISYVVSNDAAMQLYQLEQDQPGSGLALLEENLDTEAYYFLEFVESAGLESPFSENRIQQVRATFEAVFG